MRFALPLLAFISLIIVLGVGLKLNPRLVPSPLINQPAPAFDLPRLADPDARLTLDHMLGQISLLNVWASWCAACRIEHPLLLALAAQNDVPIYGLNYKDQRQDALAWLQELGNPYIANAFDQHGSVAIDFGVYGAPETFLIDHQGTIIYKHIGPLTLQDWQDTLLPLIQQRKTIAAN